MSAHTIHDLLPEPLYKFHPPGHDKGIIIPLKISGHAAMFSPDNLQAIRNITQKLISLGSSMKFVKQSEVEHINRNHAPGTGLHLRKKQPGLLHKALWYKQSCQQILYYLFFCPFRFFIDYFHNFISTVFIISPVFPLVIITYTGQTFNLLLLILTKYDIERKTFAILSESYYNKYRISCILNYILPYASTALRK